MAICHGIRHGHRICGRRARAESSFASEVIVGLGQIPLVQYATPGTAELSEAIERLCPHYDALLLANHGAVTCGPDLLTAFFRMGPSSTARRSPWLRKWPVAAAALQREVAKLMAARPRYFVAPPPGGGAELPITRDSGKRGRMM